MSEDKDKIQKKSDQPIREDRTYTEKINEGFGESKTQQDDLKKGAEIPPKKKDK